MHSGVSQHDLGARVGGGEPPLNPLGSPARFKTPLKYVRLACSWRLWSPGVRDAGSSVRILQLTP